MKKRRKELPGYYNPVEIQKKRAAEAEQKTKKLVKELKKLSKEINQHCRNKEYEVAIEIANTLNQKMNKMDDETIKSISDSALRDVIVANQAIHSASKEAVLFGLSAIITFKNPFF
jgi:hypothetical protein